MTDTKGLSSTAYGGINGNDYVPYVPVDEAMPELTAVSIILGCVFAALFGVANTYLGLKVGMTIAAGIPAAIIATGVLKGAFKRNNILECNMIQAMASMGESLAGGLIFIIPAVILLGHALSILMIVVVALIGGLMGIFFVVPLRRFLIVEEHGTLIYPEGMAASEVLVSSSAGGAGLKTVMTGIAGGGIYKFLSGGFAFWLEEPSWTIKPLQSTFFGADVLASLVGVGYIVGIEISMYMFAGALLAWFGFIPLIKYVGAGLANPLFPSTIPISQMDAAAIWSKYIRYIGAGGVATGGFISIIKSLPTIIKSFKSAIAGFGEKSEGTKRTDIDAPITWVLVAAILAFVLTWLLPVLNVGFIGAIFVIIFSFFFAVVSARLVGIIGTSNNPVSGMTIASLLFISAIIKATGVDVNAGMLSAILGGSVVCVVIAIAGGTAQSLKTTYIIGGTPKKLELGMFAGIAAASFAVGSIILLLDHTYHVGSDKLAAPQATMMSMVAKGIMTNQLPWVFVFIGVAFAIMLELMNIPILPVALGLYLPIYLSTGVLIGGILRAITDKKYKKDENLLKEKSEKGVLLASGLVAGDALVGIVIAGFAAGNVDIAFGAKIKGLEWLTQSPWTAAIAVLILVLWSYNYIVKDHKTA